MLIFVGFRCLSCDCKLPLAPKSEVGCLCSQEFDIPKGKVWRSSLISGRGCTLSYLSEETLFRGEGIDYTRKPGHVIQGKELGPVVPLEQEAGSSNMVISISVNRAV